jgi:hypothetical protein
MYVLAINRKELGKMDKINAITKTIDIRNMTIILKDIFFDLSANAATIGCNIIDAIAAKASVKPI